MASLNILNHIKEIGGIALSLFAAYYLYQAYGSLSDLKSGRVKVNMSKTLKKELAPEKKDISFEDIAGCHDLKEVLQEIVDQLQHPADYAKANIKLSTGILLTGEPGTGKTLCSKALAAMCGCNFIYHSASDFASRWSGEAGKSVKDVFASARANQPCVIFFDEIDAIGMRREGDYTNSGLQALLAEMDGFNQTLKPGQLGTTANMVFVIGATNRPDHLDPALLRPGRFDRKVVVSLPDQSAREKILELHARNNLFMPEISWGYYARLSAGASGAALRLFVNEAIRAGFLAKEPRISITSVETAFQKTILGFGLNRVSLSPLVRARISLHEVGHAVTLLSLEENRKCPKSAEEKNRRELWFDFHKITALQSPATGTGGFIQFIQESDFPLYTRSQLECLICILMGGMAAEELFCEGGASTGAASDLKQIRKVVDMLNRDFLPKLEGSSGSSPASLERSWNSPFSNDEAHWFIPNISKDDRELLTRLFAKVKALLREHEDIIRKIAQLLLDKDTLLKESIVSLLEETNRENSRNILHIGSQR
jgi:cell division protease FtsH